MMRRASALVAVAPTESREKMSLRCASANTRTCDAKKKRKHVLILVRIKGAST